MSLPTKPDPVRVPRPLPGLQDAGESRITVPRVTPHITGLAIPAVGNTPTSCTTRVATQATVVDTIASIVST